MKDKSILVFGLGLLQKSIITLCKQYGFRTIGIDPCKSPICKDLVDVFEVVRGDDYERTLAIALRYNIAGVITAATDKPLVMMAKIAERLNLPFYSVETAKISTDKFLMKQRFQQFNINCAKGILYEPVKNLDDFTFDYPVIVKPRDNSGSRGVIYCDNQDHLLRALNEVVTYTHKQTVLIEEFIDGPEYSIESIHFNGQSYVIQFTQKETTDFPYNVELGHIQPANLSDSEKQSIVSIISQLGIAMGYENCCSHTELKITAKGIYIIETSPRLGGDFITSVLTPLSTGVNIESLQIKLAVGEDITDEDMASPYQKFSGIKYFELPVGIIQSEPDFSGLYHMPALKYCEFNLKKNDRVNKITSSLNRYGYAIFQTDNREELINCFAECSKYLKSNIKIR